MAYVCQGEEESCPQEMHFNSEDIKNKRVIERAAVALLASGQVDFRTRSIARDNKGHFIVIK